MKPRFLLCIDTNKESKDLIKSAAQIAQEKNAELSLISVIDTEQTKEMVYAKIVEEYKLKVTEAIEKIHNIIYKAFPDLIVKTYIKEGFVTECIGDFIEKSSRKFHLILLGSNEKCSNTLSGIINIALKNSQCPILILPKKIHNTASHKVIL